MKKFVCKVCGYIYEGEAAPAECPVCHAKSNMFEEVKGELKLAAEHDFGVYGSTVKNNPDISAEDKKYIFDQLMANFNGECSEVGMYLCMARIAHREGYPEVGLYWEKAAYEEAEHAAKFAEMLGSDLESNMHADTKKNLAWRVDMRDDACKVVRENLAKTRLEGLGKVVRSDYLSYLHSCRETFDLIFLDPPYAEVFLENSLKTISQIDILSDSGIIITERPFGKELPAIVPGLVR